MRSDLQSTAYRADPRIEAVASWIADPVQPAQFPEHVLRFRDDRWAAAVGLDHLGDAEWIDHFARFAPLPGNLPQPLALRYHGHQFRHYNPDIGDGRGFLYAQLRDQQGRLLDLGTKGSGQTPYSRDGDGRLTLKGAVREALATTRLEALGVNTSKTFSVIETGESLWRGDEPSPTRSAVLVRLSHGHIRIGTFQRLSVLREQDNLEALIAYCLETYPGPPPPEDAPGRSEPAIVLMHQVVERLADMAASYMCAGFVHGVLNTDNMNISGESFDYGPWRWAPEWDADFTAAYFDHSGLYAFGRQPEAIQWNCAQLAVALRLVAESEPLIAALERFGPVYRASMAWRFLWRLGVGSLGQEADIALFGEAEGHMRAAGLSPDAFFMRHRGGRNAPDNAFGELLGRHPSRDDCSNSLWQEEDASGLLIDEVERIWSRIDTADDWTAFNEKIAANLRLGAVLGAPPQTGN